DHRSRSQASAHQLAAPRVEPSRPHFGACGLRVLLLLFRHAEPLEFRWINRLCKRVVPGAECLSQIMQFLYRKTGNTCKSLIYMPIRISRDAISPKWHRTVNNIDTSECLKHLVHFCLAVE